MLLQVTYALMRPSGSIFQAHQSRFPVRSCGSRVRLHGDAGYHACRPYRTFAPSSRPWLDSQFKMCTRLAMDWEAESDLRQLASKHSLAALLARLTRDSASITRARTGASAASKVQVQGSRVTRDALTTNEKVLTLAMMNLGSRGVGVDVIGMHLHSCYQMQRILIPRCLRAHVLFFSFS